jgi:ATP-dependent helicase HrpB
VTAPALPIDSVLPALRAALRARTSAVLQAPPGAGKTTRVPLALLDEPWLAGAKIVMLEPRRLAARAAAARLSLSSGTRVGGMVGYRVRLDTRVGPDTRIEVVTEGVLTRMLLDDPSLDGVGLLIFDEFHERNLQADLGLALALQARELLRPELRILVMSATLDGGPVAALLGDAAVVTSEGRAHPVSTRYRERRADQRVEAAVAAAVRDALDRDEGDVLAFLPGAAEIRRTAALLGGRLPDDAYVAPLFGALSVEEQDRAVAPAAPGRRKVVLATSIAETSLTIHGVRTVVDGGLSRVSRFSPRTGMAALETVRVSQAAADQRRGRAGRTGPGICYRLWAEHEQHALALQATPEIREADLAPLALDLAAAGVTDPSELRWLDAPPASSFAQARELLAELGALDARGRITEHGRRMARLALHPRLAHMLLASESLGLAGLACDLAALLAERDVLRPEPGAAGDADVGLRLAALRGGAAPGFVVDRDAARRAREQASLWRRQIGAAAAQPSDDASAGVLLALAYPDRVGRRRAGAAGRYLLRNGAGAAFANAQALAQNEWIVAAELDGRRPESRVYMAAMLDDADVLRLFAEQIEREAVVEWDDDAGQVIARRRARLGAIVLEDAPLRDAPAERVVAALLDGVRRRGLGALPWSDAASRLRERVAFLRTLDDGWPDWSDGALLDSLGSWLAPRAAGARRLDDLTRVDLGAALLDALPWELRARLDALAPTHVTLPTGNRAAVDYADPGAPALAVRLQELFGLADTPCIGGGRVPLTLQLLSPARRPVQVTRDLAGFWRGSYFAVRKDLRGRYPRHYWPDDPLQAEPTARAKPRGT